jgi:hypothetical protein
MGGVGGEANPSASAVTTRGSLVAPRRVAAVMGLIALTLAVASLVHLAGDVRGRSDLFDAADAGIAEAVIAAALAGGAVTMLRVPHRARTVGLATLGFATLGFLVGLSITARAGHLPDIAYHASMLPMLVGSLIVLGRTPSGSAQRLTEKPSASELRPDDPAPTRARDHGHW